MPESMAQLVQAALAAREQNSWNLARTTELWGMRRMKKLELQWCTALSFISESRPTNKNKSHKMQSATFQEVKHIHTYIYWYTCQCIRTRRPLSPVSESFCTSAHLGTHGLGKLQVFRHSFQHSVPWHWCAWCHNLRTWRFLSIFFPLLFFFLFLTFVTCFLLLLATACDTFDLFWHLLNSKCARAPQKAAPAIEVLSKNARRVEEVCINHRLSKQKVHITENAAVYYSKLSTSKAPRDVRLFEIILHKYIYMYMCAHQYVCIHMHSNISIWT